RVTRPASAPAPEDQRERRGQRPLAGLGLEDPPPRRATAASRRVPHRELADRAARHQNLTFWSPSVHFPFARRYRRPGQTVLAHHGLQADRPSEAALIAAGKKEY